MTETTGTVDLGLDLKDQLLLQVERLGVLQSSLESARLNQGLTDKFVEWMEAQMVRMSVQLEAASLRAGRLEDELHFGRNDAQTDIELSGIKKRLEGDN